MSKKRTKQQKIKAQYHYALPSTHSFSGIETTLKPLNKTQSLVLKKSDVTSLYHYDPKFITLDLRRTLTITVIILIIQTVLYLGWK